MDLLLVGVGGAIGSILRYRIGRLIMERANTTFPLGTFLVNITGATLLGILTSIDPGRNAALFFADGLLGAFTTFSTFMYEGFDLFRDNEKANAIAYVAWSLVLGVIGFAAGAHLLQL